MANGEDCAEEHCPYEQYLTIDDEWEEHWEDEDGNPEII
jgi:hypothetical protein